MKVYHGSNVRHVFLISGTFVTKRFKDACKFGYRKAVQNGAPNVFVHVVEVEEGDLTFDINRDGAFILTKMVPVVEVQRYPTYETPHKLSKFKMEVE